MLMGLLAVGNTAEGPKRSEEDELFSTFEPQLLSVLRAYAPPVITNRSSGVHRGYADNIKRRNGPVRAINT
ncbi:jg24232 [Pararge aegeria aegeria]|uniref:Jg24232 protein n=1 Tax=Pararge aegeria aegeria TaxID=348720 RepID=A0A8S4R064_9NEOP|nr:jg24232 [Pararge aegeria aegeria]